MWFDSKLSLITNTSFISIVYFQHVMRFAEVTQEVQVARPSAVKFDMGLTPGRRRGKSSAKTSNKERSLVIAPFHQNKPNIGLVSLITVN